MLLISITDLSSSIERMKLYHAERGQAPYV